MKEQWDKFNNIKSWKVAVASVMITILADAGAEKLSELWAKIGFDRGIIEAIDRNGSNTVAAIEVLKKEKHNE